MRVVAHAEDFQDLALPRRFTDATACDDDLVAGSMELVSAISNSSLEATHLGAAGLQTIRRDADPTQYFSAFPRQRRAASRRQRETAEGTVRGGCERR
jgi:hypothetical protein